jgi:hypothetical protein
MKSCVVTAILLVASCDSSKSARPAADKPASEPAIQPAPKATWVAEKGKDVALHVAGWDGAYLAFHPFDTSSTLRITAKTDFKVGTKSFEKSPSPIEVDVASYLGDLDLDEYHVLTRWLVERQKNKSAKMPSREAPQKLDVKIPFELSVGAAWQPVTAELATLELKHHAGASALAKIASKGGVKFTSDATKDKPDTLLTVFEIQKESDPLHGPGKLLKDVDWVATSTWRPVGKPRSCGGYSNVPNVAGNITVSIQPSEVEVTVYDRRTGAVVGKHVFPPAGGCPEVASSSRSDGIGARPSTIAAWLDARVKIGTFD